MNSQHRDLCRPDTFRSSRDTEVEDQSWTLHTADKTKHTYTYTITTARC